MPKIQKIDERNMESFVQTVITICDPSTNETTKAEKLKRLENTLKIFETDVNDPHGKTCLQHLLERRKFDAAKFLLENSDPKPNLNHEDRSKTTLLEKAIDGLDEITVQWLLTNGADVNYFSSTNSTPLTKAIQMYPFSLNNIKTLLRHGADRNLIGCQNATPLMISLAGSELNPIFQLLVNDPLTDLDKPCPNLDGVFPLYQATCSGSVEQMRQLLDKGANIEQVTPKNETALSVASARYEIEKVKLLLERKANPNYVIHIELGKTTNYLHRLVSLTKPETKQRDLAVARLLLQFEADPNATVEPEGSAFHLAVQFGKIEFVKLFLQKCSLFDIQSGIFTAISCNKPMIIDLFINHPRFDPKFRDDDGHGLITAACIMPPPNQTFKELNRIRKEIVDSPRIAPSRKSNKSGTDVDFKLLERFVNLGAPIDIQNMFGQNALYLASLKNNTNAVRFLLSKNANPKLVCIDGSTALHAAASYGNTELITLLLRCGVDVNIQMHDGTTPLMMAAQEGEVPAVKLLLANKADTTLTREDGMTALALAYHFQHKTTVLAFLKHSLDDKVMTVVDFRVVTVLLNSETKTNLNIFVPETIDNPDTLNQPSSSTYVESSRVSQSGFAYLRAQGFTKDEIRNMQRANGFDEPPQPIEVLEPTIPKWFGGILSTESEGVMPMQDTTTPNCYVYLPNNTLMKQGCNDVTRFQTIATKYCARRGEQGLKKLKNEYSIYVTINEKSRKVTLTHELKITSSGNRQTEGLFSSKMARILCFKVVADDKRSSLYVGCLFLKEGLHNKHEVVKLLKNPKQIQIDISYDSRRDPEHAISQTNINRPTF